MVIEEIVKIVDAEQDEEIAGSVLHVSDLNLPGEEQAVVANCSRGTGTA